MMWWAPSSLPVTTHAGHLVVADRSAVVLRLAEHRVHAFEGLLAVARSLAHPGRGGEDEDVRADDLLVHVRPGVAVAHVGFHAGPNLQPRQPNDLHVDALLLKEGHDGIVQQRPRVGGLGLRFERAVEDDGRAWRGLESGKKKRKATLTSAGEVSVNSSDTCQRGRGFIPRRLDRHLSQKFLRCLSQHANDSLAAGLSNLVEIVALS